MNGQQLSSISKNSMNGKDSWNKRLKSWEKSNTCTLSKNKSFLYREDLQKDIDLRNKQKELERFMKSNEAQQQAHKWEEMNSLQQQMKA